MKRTLLAIVITSAAFGLAGAACSDDNTGPTCGDGVCEGGETPTSCADDCGGCGNGTLDTGEQCDGQDFGGETCISQGAGGGSLFCNANCTINANYCCEHTCDTQGETRCTDSVVESCEPDSEGCRGWAAQVDCADTSEICLLRGGIAACETQCTDECPAADDTQCSGTVIQTCQLDTVDSCLYWVGGIDCGDTAQICEDALGSAVCADSCSDACPTLGVQQCDANAVEECQTGTDGCTDWVVLENCVANGEICADITGTPACCANQCTTLGELRCDPGATGIESCGVGPEGCTAWLSQTACNASDSCQVVGGQPVCLAGGDGESCSDLYGITAGASSVTWVAATNDYLTSTPSCVTSGSIAGPDVVLAYVASTDGYADVVVDKPTSTRWVMLASTATCGDVTNPMACISDFTNATMGTQFNIVAGQTYYLYLADTSSGTNPLSNPLSITITETSCAGEPAPLVTSVTPTNGATAISVGTSLVFTLDQEIDRTSGQIVITGTGGTNITYDLATAPPEVTISTNGLTVTVNPGPLFQLGETVSVTLTGIQDQLCHNVAASPAWSFTTLSSVGLGDNCYNPLTLAAGSGSYTWSATEADYFTSTPCGSTYAVAGPDVVGLFTASVSGNVTIAMTKPASARMFLTAYQGACGDLTTQVGCLNDFTPTTLQIQFPTVAGETYAVYFADTTSGTATLPNPLELMITEFDCSPVPAGVATVSSPLNGATDVYPNEPLVVSFDKAVRTNMGVITVTGTGGTNLTYDLATAPAEVAFSNADQTMTITPSPMLGLAETFTVSWTGLQDAQCGKPIAPPAWSFTTAATVPPGESCSNPVVLTAGSSSITWFASVNDYILATPGCVSVGSIAGPDVVMSYTPSVTGYLNVLFPNKPASNRWVAVVSSGACGSLTPEVACISDWSPTFMGGTFPVTAGTQYFIYVADTSSGTLPLSNPLDVVVTEIDCATYDNPPASLDPAPGSVTSSLSPVFTVVFPTPVSTTDGTVLITGDLGTNLVLPVAGTNVTFSNLNQTMVIDPALAFPAGENISITWTGLTDTLCMNPVGAPNWDVQIAMPPCQPGEGGVVGSIPDAPIPLGVTYTTEYYVAADASPTGWLYVGGTGSLYRLPKAGGTAENVYTTVPLTTSHLGYDMLVNGADIFVLNDSTTGTTGKLWRISSDGGQTWVIEDFATFPVAPNDDLRTVFHYSGNLYLVTSEGTAANGTEIWSVSAAPATLPATATLVGTVPNEAYCSGAAADDSYLYLACGTGDRVIRVAWADAPTFQPSLVTGAVDLSTVKNDLAAADLDLDGIADVLYVHGSLADVYYVCDPSGPSPYTDLLATVGSVNQGMAFDEVENALWFFDDLAPQAFVRLP